MDAKDDEATNPFSGGYRSPVGRAITRGMQAMQDMTAKAKALVKTIPLPTLPTPTKASITRNREEARQLKALEALDEGDQFSGR